MFRIVGCKVDDRFVGFGVGVVLEIGVSNIVCFWIGMVEMD